MLHIPVTRLGTRQFFEVASTVAASTTVRLATPRIAALSIIRAIRFRADADLINAASVGIGIVLGDTATPTADDLAANPRIIPTTLGNDALVNITPNAAGDGTWWPFNLQIPTQSTRLLTVIANLLGIAIRVSIQFVVDLPPFKE